MPSNSTRVLALIVFSAALVQVSSIELGLVENLHPRGVPPKHTVVLSGPVQRTENARSPGADPKAQTEHQTQQRRNLWHKIMASNIGMLLPLFCAPPQFNPLETSSVAPHTSSQSRHHMLVQMAGSKDGQHTSFQTYSGTRAPPTPHPSGKCTEAWTRDVRGDGIKAKENAQEGQEYYGHFYKHNTLPNSAGGWI